MFVTVDRAPPRRHAIDQRSAILEKDSHAFGMAYRIDRQRIAHRRIGMPEMLLVKGNVDHAGKVWLELRSASKYTGCAVYKCRVRCGLPFHPPLHQEAVMEIAVATLEDIPELVS